MIVSISGANTSARFQMLYERMQSAKKQAEKKGKAPDNTTPDSYSR